MIESFDTHDLAAGCETCGGWFGTGGFVQADGAFLTTFCSESCLGAGLRARRRHRWAKRRRYAKRVTIGVIFGGALLTPHQAPPPPRAPRVIRTVAAGPTVPDVGLAPLPPGWYGPDWPPTDVSLLAALGRDAWVHPLAGPIRRMPRTDSRVFGAVRPGDRAVECRNGHCGVDLGGEIWGEHVRAAHDGVVDWIQRGPNPLHGGEFVRLSHRDGTVFTQYFHLAAIPRALQRGTPVKGGQVIGLLGDTGVKESAPHLHFTISIRATKGSFERYVDPEPLIALWPLRVPIDGSEVGLVTTMAQPGLPLGSALLRAGSLRRHARRAPASRESTRDPGDGLATSRSVSSEAGSGDEEEKAETDSPTAE